MSGKRPRALKTAAVLGSFRWTAPLFYRKEILRITLTLLTLQRIHNQAPCTPALKTSMIRSAFRVCAYESPGQQVSVLNLNSDLQQAQVELLSAQCAVHQLRLHYSSADLARFGHREVLQKSAQAASALHEFYREIENKLPVAKTNKSAVDPAPEQVQQAVEWLSQYLLEQREQYAAVAGPLQPEQKAHMWPYFTPALLDQILVIELHGARVAVPKFFSEIRAQGFEPPEITHMESVTFLDVIAFNQQLSERALFHAL